MPKDRSVGIQEKDLEGNIDQASWGYQAACNEYQQKNEKTLADFTARVNAFSLFRF